MSTYQIRKDVPIPAKKIGKKERIYPIDILEVGESFKVPLASTNFKSVRVLQNILLQCVAAYAKKTDVKKKFTTRSTDDAVTIWRTA